MKSVPKSVPNAVGLYVNLTQRLLHSGGHHLDANILQQIYPVVEYAKATIPRLQKKDTDVLMADLYLAMNRYKNNEVQGFLGRLQRLESLKKGKEEKYLENIKKQQDTILQESLVKQTDILTAVYHKWLETLDKEYFN